MLENNTEDGIGKYIEIEINKIMADKTGSSHNPLVRIREVVLFLREIQGEIFRETLIAKCNLGLTIATRSLCVCCKKSRIKTLQTEIELGEMILGLFLPNLFEFIDNLSFQFNPQLFLRENLQTEH